MPPQGLKIDHEKQSFFHAECFPGARGHEKFPDRDANGKIIDYSSKQHGGVFSSMKQVHRNEHREAAVIKEGNRKVAGGVFGYEGPPPAGAPPPVIPPDFPPRSLTPPALRRAREDFRAATVRSHMQSESRTLASRQSSSTQRPARVPRLELSTEGGAAEAPRLASSSVHGESAARADSVVSSPGAFT